MAHITTENLQGANETVDTLVATLRELHTHGLSASVEEMALASVAEYGSDNEPLRVLARTSLLLAVCLNRLADLPATQ